MMGAKLSMCVSPCRSGGLRQAETPQLPPDRRLPGLLLRRIALLLWERQREGEHGRKRLHNVFYLFSYLRSHSFSWVFVFLSTGLSEHIPHSPFSSGPFSVGAGDFTPLPPDALPAGRDSGGSERRQQHPGEAGQEQAASPDLRERREAGPRAQGRQIRGVLGSDAGTSCLRGRWVSGAVLLMSVNIWLLKSSLEAATDGSGH